MPNVERLKQLRRVIEAAPEDRLHMRTWSEAAPCGTAYCAAGWAAVDPWFEANTPIREIFSVTPQRHVWAKDDSETFLELANLFGIKEEQADVLFGGDLRPGNDAHAVTKAEVLGTIDDLIAGREPTPYAANG